MKSMEAATKYNIGLQTASNGVWSVWGKRGDGGRILRWVGQGVMHPSWGSRDEGGGLDRGQRAKARL
jgi:hypothetical protein